MSFDYHSALKTEIVDRASSNGVNFLVAKLQSSKDKIAYSLHAEPTSYSTYGIQTTDFLHLLGFSRQRCAFIPRGECYANWIPTGFQLSAFATSFSESYKFLEAAERNLNKCGYYIKQSEGWGYFNGKASSRPKVKKYLGRSDGHTSPISKVLKESEDDNFYFVMSWIEGGTDKGWTFHYHPKHLPLSEEITTSLKFLELNMFNECPFFDFDQCHWHFFPFEQDGNRVFDSNANRIHEYFDNHKTDFSNALENLLESNYMMKPFEFQFLPSPTSIIPPHSPKTIVNEDIKQTPDKTSRKEKMATTSTNTNFDVAISFAGTERDYAEKLAINLQKEGFEVFYDNFYPSQLWGKDLPVFFDEIYRKRSRFCVIFISKEYNKRMWTNHERQSAQARALELKGEEYILPIMVDEIELRGFPPTIGYLSLSERSIEEISNLLIEKLSSN